MNDKVKLGIAIAVGLVGGGLISTFGGGPEVTKNTLLGAAPVGDFPEWTRDGSVTVVDTQLGGSTGNAKVVLRVVT